MLDSIPAVINYLCHCCLVPAFLNETLGSMKAVTSSYHGCVPSTSKVPGTQQVLNKYL